jgi:hypothetical protein
VRVAGSKRRRRRRRRRGRLCAWMGLVLWLLLLLMSDVHYFSPSLVEGSYFFLCAAAADAGL